MKTKELNVVSRSSLKIGETFFTFEYGEVVIIEDGDNVEEVTKKLWDKAHNEVDKQIDTAFEAYKASKKK